MDELITTAEASRRLRKENNRPLIRSLIAHHGIPTQRIGNAEVLDTAGFERLRRAVEEWDNRPRPSRLRRERASA